jgi:hypothetical protein
MVKFESYLASLSFRGNSFELEMALFCTVGKEPSSPFLHKVPLASYPKRQPYCRATPMKRGNKVLLGIEDNFERTERGDGN